MFWLLRFVGLRRFVGGKLRTILTILGIAAGVSSLIATGAANEAILKGFRGTLEAVGGDADISITTALTGEIDDNLPDTVRGVSGVASVCSGHHRGREAAGQDAALRVRRRHGGR